MTETGGVVSICMAAVDCSRVLRNLLMNSVNIGASEEESRKQKRKFQYLNIVEMYIVEIFSTSDYSTLINCNFKKYGKV